MGTSAFHENPFTPTFGQVPANMAGRDPLLREMNMAFGAQIRGPELTMLLSGARGSGKTVLLASIANEAEQNGWISVNTVSANGHSLRVRKPCKSDSRVIDGRRILSQCISGLE